MYIEMSSFLQTPSWGYTGGISVHLVVYNLSISVSVKPFSSIE